MTALGADRTQWADYGVNVGGDVLGTINIYPAAPAGAAARFPDGRTRPLSATRHAAARAALAALARACARAVAALAAAGLPGQDRSSDDIH
ncbi:hypothetical protein JK359_28745 [Streptomyces actinomycinicus]|uniref:Uncharacterized protein n=1 Tax=Streptomyces actinomycinicus TaxID=1695166 RepID=A0A937EPZ6_9ACTN|nr:hypothetical protein [Streptomyces actinomycinicus]MBL1085909.1 hypothetical protein [Streptomyces actinomycinicus]